MPLFGKRFLIECQKLRQNHNNSFLIYCNSFSCEILWQVNFLKLQFFRGAQGNSTHCFRLHSLLFIWVALYYITIGKHCSELMQKKKKVTEITVKNLYLRQTCCIHSILIRIWTWTWSICVYIWSRRCRRTSLMWCTLQNKKNHTLPWDYEIDTQNTHTHKKTTNEFRLDFGKSI